MGTVSHLCLTVAVMTDIHTGITRLKTGVQSLKENVNAIHEYIGVLASHLFISLILPLDELRTIFAHVKQDMKADPRLELPEDQDKKI